MLIDISAQFDMLPLTFTLSLPEKDDYTDTIIHPHDTITYCEKCHKDYEQEKASANGWKVVGGQKKRSKSQIHHKSNTKLYTVNKHDIHTTLIGQYSKDQRKKNQCKQNNYKEESNRKQYYRLYKQNKQQTSEEFRKKRKRQMFASKMKSKKKCKV